MEFNQMYKTTEECKGLILLMVPEVGEEEAEVFDSLGYLRLDSLMNRGYVGVVYRRMRLLAAIHPQLRSQADRVRDAYLRTVLPSVLAGQTDLVVVGSRPGDVDLLSFDSVHMLHLTATEQSRLSCAKYGEPGMLAVEYGYVSSVVADSVDEVVPVGSWADLPAVLAMRYVMRLAPFTLPDEESQRRDMSAVIHTTRMSTTWLESEDPNASVVLQPATLFRFDYLLAIKPEWRDSVLRVLQQSPGMRVFLQLPWYVVVPDMVERLCYASQSDGTLAVTMRGEQLVAFIRRLEGVFTAEELVGTFVGALLADRNLVVQTVRELRGRVAVPGSGERFSTVKAEVDNIAHVSDDISNRVSLVPSEYSWVYSLCDDVVMQSWPDHVNVADSMVVNIDMGAEWHHTTPMSALLYLLDCKYPGHRSELMMFMRRVYNLGPDANGYVDKLTRLLAGAIQHGTIPAHDLADIDILPGMRYLSEFRPLQYSGVFATLGFFPRLGDVFAHLQAAPFDERFVRVNSEAMRGRIFSGEPLDVAKAVMGGLSSQSGYCYLLLFPPESWSYVAATLGPFPLCSKVMSMNADIWHGKVGADLYVSRHECVPSKGGGMRYVLHLSREREFASSTPFHEFRALAMGRIKNDLMRLPMGDAGGDAVDFSTYNVWHTLAIISITVNCVVLLALLFWWWLVMRRSGPARGGRR